MAFSARTFKFDSFIYYYGIKFILNSHSWNKINVSLIYSAGPLFSLFFALFSFFLYNVFRKIQTLFNVFLLWCFVIGTCIFISQIYIIVTGLYNYTSPYYQSFAVVFSWWGLSVFLAYPLCILLLVAFVYFIINYARSFLVFSYSFSKVNSLARRRKFFFEIAIVPFALGCLITSFLTYPMNMSTHVLYLSTIGIGLITAWYLLSYVQVMKYELVRYKSLQKINVFFSILLLVAGLIVFITYRGTYFPV